jgi:hypothetical protein
MNPRHHAINKPMKTPEELVGELVVRARTYLDRVLLFSMARADYDADPTDRNAQAVSKASCHQAEAETALRAAMEAAKDGNDTPLSARERVLRECEAHGWQFQQPFVIALRSVVSRRRRECHEAQIQFWLAMATEAQLQEAFGEALTIHSLTTQDPPTK